MERMAASDIRKLTDWLASRPDLRIAVLFGSLASGNAGPDSDVDLAIASDHPLSTDDKITLIDDVSRAMGREVDLVDLRAAVGTILAEALSKGTILKNSDPTLFADLLKRMWLDQADFEPQRQKMLEAARRRVLDG